MSAKLLPREMGCILTCNGCGTTLQTANILKGSNRAWAKTEHGWGRGLIRKRKQLDLCGECMPKEREAFAKLKAEREKRRLERDEKARAKRAA